MIKQVADAIADMPAGFIDPEAVARVAITAMRKPTRAMVDAAYSKEEAIFGVHPHANMNISTAWETMIDTALAAL